MPGAKAAVTRPEPQTRSEHVAPREQYDRNQHYYRYDHLTGRAVENSALSLIVRLHRHDSLLG